MSVIRQTWKLKISLKQYFQKKFLKNTNTTEQLLNTFSEFEDLILHIHIKQLFNISPIYL